MSRVGWKRTALGLLAAVVITLLGSSYLILDQALTITYMEVGYDSTKSDLELLGRVAPQLHRGSSKRDILGILRELEPNGLIVERGGMVRAGGLEFRFDSSGSLSAVE